MSPEPIGPGSSETKPKSADGAEGVTTHVRESVVNLEVALKLQKLLEARGVHVVMVRTSENVNISSSQRAEIANRAHAGLFLRPHCDGADNSGPTGIQTLVPASTKWTGTIVAPSTKAGRLVEASVVSATRANDRGITPRSDLAGFNWSKVPSVLVEMGFLSNPAEERRLVSAGYQQPLAEGIADGTMSYLRALR
jgi:N-acetylmuramoyl-L-alanine amidase